MGWMDNIKGMLNKNDQEDEIEEETEEFEDDAEDTFEEEDTAVEEEEEAPAPKQNARFELHTFGGKTAERPAAKSAAQTAPKPIIDFNESQGGNITMDNFTGERSQILLYKPQSLEGIKLIADRVNQKKTVILNLEGQDEDFIKTIIDFFSGVAYANHGKLSPIADKTYIVTPDNIDMNRPEGANIGDSELGSLNILDALNDDAV